MSQSLLPGRARGLRLALGLLLCASAAPFAAGCSGDDKITPTETDASVGADSGGGRDGGAIFPDSGISNPGGLSVSRVVPGNGPFTGGTRAVVRGSGFTGESVVTFDGRMVQPADTELLDPGRLRVVVPAGDVGPADVAVTVGDATATAPAAYVYDAIYVDPDSGSIAGGTLVNVVGSGTAFTDGDTVRFGRSLCTGVSIVSPTRITCQTPPGAPGSVDVTVIRGADGAETTAVDGFTYYDTSDPYGGGLGGGPISGTINLTVLDATSGLPVDGAFSIVGEVLTTPYQGLTNTMGQISFSGPDLMGRQTITVAKHCYEKTSFVSFDARDVTIFLVPWMDPMCGMGMPPPPGRGRNGSFVEGELIWRGPMEFGPNPWANIPPPRTNEVKVAYVYGTQANVRAPNPDPASGGAIQRVLETPLGMRGYPYRIFVRPSGMAVYALAGLENTVTGEFFPYVMGVARNVLAGPGETVRNVDIVMEIPLDHAVDVNVSGLPMAVRTGPDRFKTTADIDLGGEGVIVRQVADPTSATGMRPIDEVRQRRNDRPFRFTSQPALLGALSDGRYRFEAGWYTGDFDSQPYTVMVRNGVSDVSSAVEMNGFLGIPQPVAPAYGERLPDDRMLRWMNDGPDPDFYVVLMVGGDGNPAWRHFTPGDTREAPIPDLSTVPGIDDISSGFITWVVFSVRSPGFRFDEFRYSDLVDQYWSHWAVDYFLAQR